MSNGTKPPGQPTQVQFNVKLDELPTVLCPICGGSIFNTGIGLFKLLSALRSPKGKPQLIRVALICCMECGAVAMPVDDKLKLIEVVPKEKTEDET